MKLFIDKLIEQIEKKNSCVCVGLDPHLEMLPSSLFSADFNNKFRKLLNMTNSGEDKDVFAESELYKLISNEIAEAVLEFNKKIIEQIAEHAAAVKPQIAFYELLGPYGMQVLQQTVSYASRMGLIVILDAKRNDIGSTATAYAEAYLGFSEGFTSEDSGAKQSISIKKMLAKTRDVFEVDCLTVNPYLGYDGIKPFLTKKDKGAFALLRTSNESAGDIQDLVLEDGQKVFSRVGQLISDWGKDLLGENGYSNLGAVVGATYPEELKVLREAMPESFFLIPGFGFQGGQPEDVKYGFNEDGLGALINSSRGIDFAYLRSPWQEKFSEAEFAEAAGAAAEKMKNDINQIIEGEL